MIRCTVIPIVSAYITEQHTPTLQSYHATTKGKIPKPNMKGFIYYVSENNRGLVKLKNEPTKDLQNLRKE